MLTALLLLALDQSAATATLLATTPWNLDVAGPCTLTRQYGAEQQPLTLSITQSPIGKIATLSLSLRPDDKLGRKLEAKLSTNDATTPISAIFEKLDYAERPRTVATKLTKPDVAALVQASEWTIEGLTAEPIHIRTGGSQRLQTALSECDSKLAADWQIDIENVGKVAKPATATGGPYWFSDADYPASARRDRQEGPTSVIYKIGADGAIKECRVVASSGSEALDRTTCILVSTRPRYRPAEDEKGRPIESWQFRKVNRRLPR